MNKQITKEDIKNNTFFWYSYISWFNGFDEKKEINIDEALDVVNVNKQELYDWEKSFFPDDNSDEYVRCIGGKLNEEISFCIEFHKDEVVYFLNDKYIGNLGGHFEGWFLTLEELIKFGNHDLLFLLLLPMTGVEQEQIKYSQTLIAEQLRTISHLVEDAEYIAECIVNGLLINGKFSIKNNIGTVNNQNHSVRNIDKYPEYKDDVIKLNLALKSL